MWCSAATLTRTTQGTGPPRVRSARSVGSSTTPTMSSGPIRVTCSRTGSDPSGPEPTSTARSASGALTGTGDWSARPAPSQVTTCRRLSAGTMLSSGGTSSSWPCPVAGPVSSRGPSCWSRSRRPGSTGRSTRVSSSTRSASGRSAGSFLRSSERMACAVSASYWKPGVCRHSSSGRSRPVSPKPYSASPSRRKVRPDRHGSHSTSDENGSSADRAAASVAPSRMPTPATVGAPRSRRYWRAASMLASQAGTRSASSWSPAESPVPS